MWRRNRHLRRSFWLIFIVSFFLLHLASGSSLNDGNTVVDSQGTIDGNLSVNMNVDAPDEVKTGEWYNIYVNLTSDENMTVKVYSYIFRELNCISQGWTANQKKVKLIEGEPTQVTLEDRIKNEVEEGIYKFRVRVRKGEKKRDFTHSLKVKSNSSSFDFKTLLYSSLVLSSLVAVVYMFAKER